MSVEQTVVNVFLLVFLSIIILSPMRALAFATLFYFFESRQVISKGSNLQSTRPKCLDLSLALCENMSETTREGNKRQRERERKR
jgi:hypothetical protein